MGNLQLPGDLLKHQSTSRWGRRRRGKLTTHEGPSSGEASLGKCGFGVESCEVENALDDRRRKAPVWKHRPGIEPIAFFCGFEELLGPFHEVGPKVLVVIPHRLAHLWLLGKEEYRSRRLLALAGKLFAGILSLNRIGSSYWAPSTLRGSLFLDLGKELGHHGPVFLWGVVLKSGQRLQIDLVTRCIVVLCEVDLAAPGVVFLRAIEPIADDRLAVEKCLGGCGSRPVEGAFDEASPSRLGKAILETLPLVSSFVTDAHAAVSTGPELVFQAVQTSDFSGTIGVEVILESRHLKCVVDTVEQMVMSTEDAKSVDTDVVVLSRTAQGAKDAFVRFGARTQQRQTVEGVGAGFDDTAAFANVAERSGGKARGC
jgi:hypothetical protein